MSGHAFLVLAALSAAVPARAEAPQALDLPAAAKIALAESPDLLALHLQEEALRERAWQNLAPAEPTVNFSRNNLSALSLNAPTASKTTTLSMTIGFPGKAVSAFRGGRFQERSTRELGLSKEIDILAALRSLYAALWENGRVQALIAEEVQKEEDILKILERKYSMAQATQVDLLNAQVTLAGLKQNQIVAKDTRDLLLNQFLTLIKKPGSKEFAPRVPEDLAVPPLAQGFDALKETMLRNQHGLLSAQFAIRSLETALTQAELAPMPDLQLSVAKNTYEPNGVQPAYDFTRNYDYSASVGLALPIFFPFNELRGITAAKKDLAVARAQWESSYLAAVSQLQQLVITYQNTQREKDNLDSLVIPAAKASYDLNLRNYALGRADFLVLNDSRNTWLSAVQSRMDHDVALVSLYAQISQQLGCFIDDKEGTHACH